MDIKHRLAETKDDFVEWCRKVISPVRRKKISDKNFTIISNNCWGGKIYQRYGLQYSSPTVGLYFFAEDYLKLLNNLKHYMSLPLEIIPVEESRYYDILKERKQLKCPIGRIDDVEIVFQHYKVGKEAKEKWEGRKKRINWDNIIVKFSQMNYCTTDHLKQFQSLGYDVKFAFVNTEELKSIGAAMVYFPGYESKPGVMNDTTKYCKYIDVNELINHKILKSTCTKFFQ